jgi:formate-dependent nitrite reductase membrane component NrfD
VKAGGRRGGEKQMVPEAEFSSYYGRPVLKETVWGADIPSYLFLGGLAGASSALAAAAHLSGHLDLARAAKAGAAGAISLSMVALVHDLGRPLRFINMLRVFKVTSPMSVGTWLLSGYTPLALGAAACAVTGKLPRVDLAATVPAAVLGPAVASYTSVLLADTAVPAWHDAHRELPFVFVGSAMTAAGGLGMLAVRPDDARQAVRFGVMGASAELIAKRLMMRRLGPAAEPYQKGRAGTMMEAAEGLIAVGLVGAVLAGRSRAAAVLGGAALMAASALTRFGIFEAGRASARDPKYTVGPQRQRLREQGEPASEPPPAEDSAASPAGSSTAHRASEEAPSRVGGVLARGRRSIRRRPPSGSPRNHGRWSAGPHSRWW